MKLTCVTKHHTLIIFLHWSMALTLLLMLLTGEFMEDSLRSPIFCVAYSSWLDAFIIVFCQTINILNHS